MEAETSSNSPGFLPSPPLFRAASPRDVDSTYCCTMCGKKYSSQNSLKRHARIHRDANGHLCTICHVAFARSDLLARHLKIHDNCGVEGVSKIVKQLPRRLRCHTACTACKKARTKCDGHDPCAACTSSQRACQYLRPTLRTSQAPHLMKHNPDYKNDESSATCSTTMDQVEQPYSRDLASSPYDHADDIREPNEELQSQHITLDPETTNAAFACVEDELIGDGLVGDDLVGDDLGGIDLFFDLGSKLGAVDDSMYNDIDEPWDCSPTTSFPLLQEDLFPRQAMLVDWIESPADVENLSQAVVPNGKAPVEEESQTMVNFEKLTTQYSVNHNSQEETLAGAHHDIFKTFNSLSANGILQLRTLKTSTQDRAVDEMVKYATNLDSVSDTRRSRSACWRSLSVKVCYAFLLETNEIVEGLGTYAHCLHRCVQLFMEHFSPLWPLISLQNFDPDALHPLLYLTCVSIGAMYLARPSHMGMMIHERLCEVLSSYLFDFERSDDELISLAQARLLTQVVALYFGRRRGLSFAQQLGGTLVAQSRRMRLFNMSRSQDSVNNRASAAAKKVNLTQWKRQEGRRRLAFGILRAEAYTSVLLNTKPLVTAEEIGLTFPYPEAVWCENHEYQEDSISKDTADTCQLPFAHLFWVTMDKDELIPHLEPKEYELLLFGLQDSVWRFCHDPDLLFHLRGSIEISSDCQESVSNSNQLKLDHASHIDRHTHDLQDHLGGNYRAMKAFEGDKGSLYKALEKWKQAFTSNRTHLHLTRDRTTLLSSLLLYHISYLRLNAPLENLHHISRQHVDKRPIENDMMHRVQSWTKTGNASLAVYHACKICSLLALESLRMEDRARCNFLAYAGLYHAAVVVWTYAGTHEYSKEFVLELPAIKKSIVICRAQTAALLDSFVDLYRIVGSTRWTSFVMVAIQLSKCKFPMK